MTNEDKIELTERGKIFCQFALGNHYKAYSGNMFINTYFGPVLFNGEGRIIIDVNGHTISDPNSYGYNYDNENESIVTQLDDDKLCLTWPFLPAFSLNAKQWGQIFLKNVSDVVFDENAFDLLVLNEQKKKLTKILVMNATAGFTDIISGKSGGCIFLLHGSPGTGKTLTTESISELLHMPLYSVTSGELGTSPQEVEKTLQKILRLAQSWNAIILLDEADIFLQKRNDTDIVRNAIVGIFLRLLERYKGIMFLTTNRQTELDKAFQSRITITFEYDDLAYYDRLKVWKNLLKASRINLSTEDIECLAKYEINGRQIKNVIRLSNTLAINDNLETNRDHFYQIMNVLY